MEARARSGGLANDLGGVPPDYFVIKLYQMLREQKEVIAWDPEGGIIIHDRQRLEATLSVYFRHNRFTSFQRQLNNFGFHKKRKGFGASAAGARKGAAYDHPLLCGEQPEASSEDASDGSLDSSAQSTATLSNSNSGGDLEGLARDASDAASPPSPRVLPPPVPTAASALASALARPGGPVAAALALPELFSARARARAALPCVLKDMIDNTPDDVVAWSDDGRVFLVRDADALCKDVLPKYFRHCRLASFQRQLSLYQFRRARMQRPAAPDGRPAAKPHGGGLPLAYHHPKFVRDADEAALRQITRAAPSRPRRRRRRRRRRPTRRGRRGPSARRRRRAPGSPPPRRSALAPAPRRARRRRATSRTRAPPPTRTPSSPTPRRPRTTRREARRARRRGPRRRFARSAPRGGGDDDDMNKRMRIVG
ncbi:hypothetical protein JL722_1099 [Aureococcus anophagefferens]|nr:hypothetical protein JL722_1099 [Aureococcus anophagefferens]